MFWCVCGGRGVRRGCYSWILATLLRRFVWRGLSVSCTVSVVVLVVVVLVSVCFESAGAVGGVDGVGGVDDVGCVAETVAVLTVVVESVVVVVGVVGFDGGEVTEVVVEERGFIRCEGLSISSIWPSGTPRSDELVPGTAAGRGRVSVLAVDRSTLDGISSSTRSAMVAVVGDMS